MLNILKNIFSAFSQFFVFIFSFFKNIFVSDLIIFYFHFSPFLFLLYFTRLIAYITLSELKKQ
ncbi:unnamed protein product [Meloidogyne enterolobii]|uniref:Uncharacterized protein n=1 Tax=Meloidogyne enterolobii TaxID=390850 RepID=A0ACB1AJ97_MELEN